MMTREEFERTVRAMKSEGVALSMPNLMVRTELPRHVIEDWLEEMDDPRRKAPTKVDGKLTKPRRDGDNPDAADAIFQRVNELKDEFVKGAAKAAVREKLGLGDDDEESVHGARVKPSKDLRVGGGLGLVLGPFGFFYAAPYPVAILASLAYVAVGVGVNFIPVFGAALFAYMVPLVHIGSGIASAGYTWRYNRSGKRAALLPKNRED